MKKPLPPRDTIWVDEQGRPTELFYEYVADADKRAFREPVAIVSPTNGQVMVFNSTTGLWTPGAN